MSDESTPRPWIRVEGPPLGHIPAFDGIRGFFVVLVVLFHAYVINRFVPGGAVVIDFFFVMSGFLITTLLMDEHQASGGISLRKFYARRALRLFPAMYLMIALFVVVMIANDVLGLIEIREGYAWHWEAIGASLYSYHVFYAFDPDMAGAISHTWSLSVEEQFYFLWPALFAVAITGTLKYRSRRAADPDRRLGADRALVIGAASFVLSMFLIRLLLQGTVTASGMHMEYADADDPTWQGVLYRLAGSRPDMVVYGCLLAIGIRHVPRPVPQKWLDRLRIAAIIAWVLFVVAMCASGRLPGFQAFGGPLYQLAMLGLGVMTIDFFLRRDSAMAKFFSAKPFRTLGERSYGIYLWHIPALWLFLPLLEGAAFSRQLAIGIPASLLAIGAGFLSLRFIEKPFLKLKDRRFRRPDDAPATRPPDAASPGTASDPARSGTPAPDAARSDGPPSDPARSDAARSDTPASDAPASDARESA